DQRKALDLALASKISVITGGPGVGKTYTLNMIIQALGPKKVVYLAAPTGKAAKRMNEATNHEAKTIHRLLKYNPMWGGFEHSQESPLDCDVLIIDESSMMDICLTDNLLDAINSEKTQLILVGDKDQLPSVGPGAVLGDIIESEAVPVAHLKTLHRQASKSLININAQKINRGEEINFTPIDGGEPDMWFVPEEDPQKIADRIVTACQNIPDHFNFGPDDIQILCPQKKGPVGTGHLNKILREKIFNPIGEEIKGSPFRIGDRVIQLKNNYDYGVFNGDIGVIKDACGAGMVVEFEANGEAQAIEYTAENYGQLALAYALTIHKSQGSEFPVVIMPMHTTNY
ncbi:MAG: AAA family ATPase, partial [Desulfobacterales bacterium]|nr:AAA family ATPase [Desulfobacterales bacterium]